jgi:hypothetical protein
MVHGVLAMIYRERWQSVAASLSRSAWRVARRCAVEERIELRANRIRTFEVREVAAVAQRDTRMAKGNPAALDGVAASPRAGLTESL